MRPLFFILAAIAALLPVTAFADVPTCIKQKWDGVIHNQLPIGEAFAIHYITARTIGPLYRTLNPTRQREARNATQYALQEALGKNIGTLRKVTLTITGEPIARERSYEVTGVFVHPRAGSYNAQAWVAKKDCTILAMVIERDFLVKKMNEFLRTFD